jgi:hypothetical protein
MRKAWGLYRASLSALASTVSLKSESLLTRSFVLNSLQFIDHVVHIPSDGVHEACVLVVGRLEFACRYFALKSPRRAPPCSAAEIVTTHACIKLEIVDTCVLSFTKISPGSSDGFGLTVT